MKLILENWNNFLREQLESEITAYHCGRNIESEQFSLEFFNTGERFGYPPLGPGIYFATEERIARAYCHYHPEPYLYEVRIPTKSLYNLHTGEPEELRERLAEWSLKNPMRSKWSGEELHPWDKIERITRTQGAQKAAKVLSDLGIRGGWTTLLAGGLEVAVYDTSIVTIVNKEGITNEENT